MEDKLKVETGEIRSRKGFPNMDTQAKRLETSVALPDQAIVNDLKDLDQKIRSMMSSSENRGNSRFAVSVERKGHIRTFKITLKLIISLVSPTLARCVKKCSGQDTV